MSELTPEDVAQNIIKAEHKAYPDATVFVYLAALEAPPPDFPRQMTLASGKVIAWTILPESLLDTALRAGLRYVGIIVILRRADTNEVMWNSVGEEEKPIVAAAYQDFLTFLEKRGDTVRRGTQA